MMVISFTSLALIVLGLAFMITELGAPAFGALGIIGITAFTAGLILLGKPVDPNAAWLIPWHIIGLVALLTGGFFYMASWFALKANRRKIVSGQAAMVGEIGVVESNSEWVWVMSERWHYESAAKLMPGQHVRVMRVDGMVLQVEPVSEKKGSEE